MGGLFLLVFVSPRITYLTPFPENIYKLGSMPQVTALSINTATLQDSNFERQPFNVVTRLIIVDTLSLDNHCILCSLAPLVCPYCLPKPVQSGHPGLMHS